MGYGLRFRVIIWGHIFLPRGETLKISARTLLPHIAQMANGQPDPDCEGTPKGTIPAASTCRGLAAELRPPPLHARTPGTNKHGFADSDFSSRHSDWAGGRLLARLAGILVILRGLVLAFWGSVLACWKVNVIFALFQIHIGMPKRGLGRLFYL